MPLKIYFLAKAPDATSYFRVQLPATALQAQGHDVRVDYLEHNSKIPGSGAKADSVEWADVIVVQRPTNEKALQLLRVLKAQYPKKPLLGDYDDDYYSVPEWNPGYQHIKSNERFWRPMVRLFDGIIVSTDPLEDAFREGDRYNGSIAVIPNGFDFQAFDALEDAPEFAIHAVQVDAEDNRKLRNAYSISNRQFNELMKDRPVIAWAGSQFHYLDLEWIAADVKIVCEKHPDAVFLFVGYTQGNLVNSAPLSRVFACGGALPVTNFYRMLRSLKIDISLAPLHPVEFNQAKSNLKVVEAFALNSYPICSDLDPYLDDIGDVDKYDHGYGTLVRYQDKPGAWAKAILDAIDLMKDPVGVEMRRTFNAAVVRNKHSHLLRAGAYEEFFTEMLAKGNTT